MKPHLFEPLSHALLPTVLGLTRTSLLRFGVSEHDCTLHGVPVHYYHHPGAPGSDPHMPILLIHGIADNALTWAFTIHGLAKLGPVYVLDLPGFGLSGYPKGRRYAALNEHVAVVQALIREVIGHPTLLVGNSLGGWIGIRLALVTPDLTTGLILLDPGGAMLDGRPSWQPFIDTVAVPDLRTVRTIFHQMFRNPSLIAALYLGQHGFQTLFRRDSVTHFVAATSEDDFFRSEELHQLQVPVGLIWGMTDRFLPSGSFEFFRDHLPTPSVLTLRGCGHLPQRERPLRVVRFIRQFVAERVHAVPTSG